MMDDLIAQAEQEFNEMKANAQELEKGKKVAASRTRKNAMNLTKICKQIRVQALVKQKSM